MSKSPDKKLFCSDFEKAFFGMPTLPSIKTPQNSLMDAMYGFSLAQQQYAAECAMAMTFATMQSALRCFQLVQTFPFSSTQDGQ